MPGDRIEPERKLAARFGVNRATLRQALKVLVVMGVVRQRVGDGTYVTTDAFTILEPRLAAGRIPGKTQPHSTDAGEKRTYKSM